MRTFFVKIGKAGVPARNVNPRTGADWERGQFIAPKAKRLNPRGKPKFIDAKAPQNGDHVYIWVNQADRGGGLTAVGIIEEIKPTDKNITFVLKDVDLFRQPYVTFESGPDSSRYFSRGASTVKAYGFLLSAHHNRHDQTRELDEDHVNDINSVLETLGATVDLPLGFDPSDPVDERRKQESLRAVREGAKSFRDAMMMNWGGQCAITRTSMEPALEAAHICPYGGVKTNDKRNGILLRADVHRLFDQHLISFVYQGAVLVVRVSTSLAGSEYTKCDGKRIELPIRPRTCPDPKVVNYHYDLFLKAEAKR